MALVAGLLGCADTAHQHDDAAAITLRFALSNGESELRCGDTAEGIGLAGSAYTITDARLYLHDVELLSDLRGEWIPVDLTPDGAWQTAEVALLNFAGDGGECDRGSRPDPIRAVVVGAAPLGSYSGVRFVLGVPFDENHGDAATAPSPLNLTSMFWSWRGGYKFLRFEGTLDAGPGHRVHLGSTGCTGAIGAIDACARPNRAPIELVGGDPLASTIVLDIGEFFGDVDVSENTLNTPPGCMSEHDDPDCAPIFDALGLDLDTGEPAAPQRAFVLR